ncbi:MAG: hypothetical protein EXS16_09115 [Gemmataceae bacterium]|nr:hypothetical protein [Gemmataceae bacterium]
MIPRVPFTYGQVDNVLRALGFSRHEFETHSKGVRYDHKESGAIIILPLLPKRNRMLDYHYALVRGTLEDFGVADRPVFEATLNKAS